MNLTLKAFLQPLDESAVARTARARIADWHRELKRRLGQARPQVERKPTPAQREAGNYRKGHVRLHGLDVTIENPRGSVRTAADGSWSRRMAFDYGYIRKTTGRDGDHVDVYIGDHPASQIVFVVDQVGKDGAFDEHKVILGALTEAEARQVYASAYPAGWRIGPVTSLTLEQFKAWLRDGDQTKPLAPRVRLVIKGIRDNPGNVLGLDRIGRTHWRRRLDRNAATLTEAKSAASDFIGKTLKNRKTGIEAVVSGKCLKKMLDKSAVAKSHDKASQALAIANIDRLFEEALLGWSKPDRDGDKNIAAIHRFFSPMERNGRTQLVKLTVKETGQRHQQNPLYTIETVELSDKSPAAIWIDAAIRSDGIDPISIRSAGDAMRLARGVEAFNRSSIAPVVKAQPLTLRIPICSHCGSRDSALLPPDFETRKCNQCRRNFQGDVAKARPATDPRQLSLFGGASGSIRNNPTNRLGVDRIGRVHWRTTDQGTHQPVESIRGVSTYVRNDSPNDPFRFKSTKHQTVAWDAEGYPARTEIVHAKTRAEYEAKLAEIDARYVTAKVPARVLAQVEGAVAELEQRRKKLKRAGNDPDAEAEYLWLAGQLRRARIAAGLADKESR